MKPRRYKSKYGEAVTFALRAKGVIEAIAAVLTPLCWNSGSFQTRPRRVVFTVRDRLDSDVMHSAFARLKNAGVLVPVKALGLPVHTPEFARFRAAGGMKVEFRALITD